MSNDVPYYRIRQAEDSAAGVTRLVQHALALAGRECPDTKQQLGQGHAGQVPRMLATLSEASSLRSLEIITLARAFGISWETVYSYLAGESGPALPATATAPPARPVAGPVISTGAILNSQVLRTGTAVRRTGRNNFSYRQAGGDATLGSIELCFDTQLE